MLDVIRIELQAREPAANCFRAWRVEAGSDLFGKWTARVTFRRIGRSGRSLAKLFASEAEATAFVRRGLRRRQTSVRRFGVPYRLLAASPAAIPLLALTGLLPQPAAAGAAPSLAIPTTPGGLAAAETATSRLYPTRSLDTKMHAARRSRDGHPDHSQSRPRA